MSILKDIVAKKIEEVNARKRQHSIASLEAAPGFGVKMLSYKEHLLNPEKHGIIAEFKRKSPSKGVINANAVAREITPLYEAGGASCLSVLTETAFFSGSDADLLEAKSVTTIPVIRKDFIIDRFQIAEAKALGADAILLIAEILGKNDLAEYYSYACQAGLEVLIEVHGEEDLLKLPEAAQIVGVNSRNLNTFNVSLEHTANMLTRLPAGAVKVAESGIVSVDDYIKLKSIGFDAFLIGEFFMRNPNPGDACKAFTESINKALQNGIKG